MRFKLSCSFGALAILGVVFAGGSRSYAGVAYAHFGQDESQKTVAVQQAPADLPRVDLLADPASAWLNRQGYAIPNEAARVANTADSSDSRAAQWLAKWDTGSAESSTGPSNLRTAKPASVEEDPESAQAQPLAIPTPSAWSVGLAGLLGLGLARVIYRTRRVRRNY